MLSATTMWLCAALSFLCLVSSTTSSGDVKPALKNRTIEHVGGRIISEDLAIKLQKEASEWHYLPWHATKTKVLGDVLVEDECAPGDNSYPDLWLTDEQILYGGFLLYMFVGVYAFVLLAVVCNDYFIPCVELICEDLNIPENVAAATFMAVATSCPEFFVNTISTFISESDMGIGTIIGSALFNALGVAAVGSLAASKPIELEARPVTRDVLIYLFNVSILVGIVWDGKVMWYEATVLACLYIVYFIFMFNSVRMFKKLDQCFKKEEDSTAVVQVNGKVDHGRDNEAFEDYRPEIQINGVKESAIEKTRIDDNGVQEAVKPKKSLFRFPREAGVGKRFWWVYTWPLKLVLTLTIPSPKTYRRFYPLAFFMCICWIGGNSYIVSWMMTVLGSTFMIPDSVMGMTFLAFGGCLPEACSIFIMSRKGLGGIGVSNALGANTLAILFALGVPWFIRCMVLLGEGVESAIIINSDGIDFIIISLFLAVVSLWTVLKIAKFTLRFSIGFIFVGLYLIYITFAILVETGVIIGSGTVRC